MRPHLKSISQRELISHHGIGSLWLDHLSGQKALYADQQFRQGEIIMPFEAGAVMNHPTKYTVQVNEDTHIILKPLFLQYINHGCSPNVFFDTDNLLVRCLRDINSGDEFTFFYPSTEWSMTEQFTCFCGSDECIGEIRGAKHIPDAIIARYKLTNYIKNKIPHRELSKSTGP